MDHSPCKLTAIGGWALPHWLGALLSIPFKVTSIRVRNSIPLGMSKSVLASLQFSRERDNIDRKHFRSDHPRIGEQLSVSVVRNNNQYWKLINYCCPRNNDIFLKHNMFMPINRFLDSWYISPTHSVSGLNIYLIAFSMGQNYSFECSICTCLMTSRVL